MNYETALALKEAGFPQNPHGRQIFQDGHTEPDSSRVELNWIDTREMEPHSYAPTLSELIEACGNVSGKFGKQEDGRWYFEFDIDDGNGNLLDFCLPTQEEVYALLYLSLHGKKD